MIMQKLQNGVAACLCLVMLWGAPGALHADDGMWTTGTTIAKGHFTPQELCKNAGHGCRVLGDSVAFRIDHAAGRAEGVALAKIAYRPYPECAEWELISYIAFSGDYWPPTETTHVYMMGRLDAMMSLDFEMWDARSGTCKKGHRDIPDTGGWEGGHNVATDQYVIQMALKSDTSNNSAMVVLDGTWSADASGSGSPPTCAPGDTSCAADLINDLLGL
jgi:hypothetical protein